MSGRPRLFDRLDLPNKLLHHVASAPSPSLASAAPGAAEIGRVYMVRARHLEKRRKQQPAVGYDDATGLRFRDTLKNNYVLVRRAGGVSTLRYVFPGPKEAGARTTRTRRSRRYAAVPDKLYYKVWQKRRPDEMAAHRLDAAAMRQVVTLRAHVGHSMPAEGDESDDEGKGKVYRKFIYFVDQRGRVLGDCIALVYMGCQETLSSALALKQEVIELRDEDADVELRDEDADVELRDEDADEDTATERQLSFVLQKNVVLSVLLPDGDEALALSVAQDDDGLLMASSSRNIRSGLMNMRFSLEEKQRLEVVLPSGQEGLVLTLGQNNNLIMQPTIN